MFVIPNYLHDEIYRKIDAAISDCPGAAGRIPDFAISGGLPDPITKKE